jgi:hypothetical protein
VWWKTGGTGNVREMAQILFFIKRNKIREMKISSTDVDLLFYFFLSVVKFLQNELHLLK